LGKKCSRCSTRYCGPACQKKHWEEGGHDKLCKKIRKGGGAEQNYAENKCAESIAVAVAACATDTKGQTCYICTEAVHWKTKEGLVRMCVCRGTSGFAHVSCLAEQAKILFEEAEENNLDKNAPWGRWNVCGLCEQRYHSVVACALGWACWKTYLGRPETDEIRSMALGRLGIGLTSAKQYEDALSVQEAELNMERRLGASDNNMLAVQGNLASTYENLGHHELALQLKHDAYSGYLELYGEEHMYTLLAASNYTTALLRSKRFEEVKPLLRKAMPVARRVLGESHDLTVKMRANYAQTLYMDPDATLDDLREAVETLEDATRTSRRVFGGTHPTAVQIESNLAMAREFLRVRELGER